ncbi:hypothetical protein RF11_00489 [Thelohanellus kitauei]|uniref:Uncharacterized protein n=1 Tax=Thelohanellus kitauei TaxID=669202 RepID=A0A0C2IT46_THEKT|nr:hypothetical protein RF11_00489 [Thelohanellus kitauei]
MSPDQIRSKILSLQNDIRVITQEKERYEEEYDHKQHEMNHVIEVIEDLRQHISTLEKTLETQEKDSLWSQNARDTIKSYKQEIRIQEQQKMSILGEFKEKNRKIGTCKEKIKGLEDEIESLRASLINA